MLLGLGLLLFPSAIRKRRRAWSFTSVLFLILITTVGILVLIYSDNYMSHDQGYLRFFAYMSFFNNLMLTLVSSFWFVRPIASNACQKAFLTNRVGDFGLLLGILGFYWLTGRPTPISALIHAATMVSSGNFSCSPPSSPFSRYTLHNESDSCGRYNNRSGSIIHSMENIVGYSPDKSQNMVLMGGLRKHIPITQVLFLLGTLSLCGIPPLACFWSKDEILNATCSTAGLTAFYMFRVYLLTFEGHFNVHFQNYSGKKNSSFYSISLWGNEKKNVKKKIPFINFIKN
ncbi:NAD(P)H-quinone oxidoreductase subunit 5, chloroplastic [Linum perenne]